MPGMLDKTRLLAPCFPQFCVTHRNEFDSAPHYFALKIFYLPLMYLILLYFRSVYWFPKQVKKYGFLIYLLLNIAQKSKVMLHKLGCVKIPFYGIRG